VKAKDSSGVEDLMPFPATPQINKEQDTEPSCTWEFPGSQQCAPSVHEKIFGFEISRWWSSGKNLGPRDLLSL
jgi:hypothetical protein